MDSVSTVPQHSLNDLCPFFSVDSRYGISCTSLYIPLLRPVSPSNNSDSDSLGGSLFSPAGICRLAFLPRYCGIILPEPGDYPHDGKMYQSNKNGSAT
jgi:hypothetical protein